MKVFVTGANGLLATHIIQQLLENGYFVRGFLRDKKKFQLAPHQNLELTEGDVQDKSLVENAVKDCDYIIHVAAITAPNQQYEAYYQVNVLGTQHIIAAALKYSIKKLVYVSSANALGHGSKEKPGNETTPVKEPFLNSFYAKSKLEAQKKVLAISHKMDVVVVNPTFMLGAYDAKPSSGEIVLMGYNRKFVFYPPGGKNFVNAKDVAKGTLTALEKGKNGEIYLMAGENLSYKEFFEKVEKKSIRKTNMIQVPKFVLLALGYLSRPMGLLGVKTKISVNNMKIISINNFYSNQKAEKELGIKFGSIDEGIDEAIAWFEDKGMV